MNGRWWGHFWLRVLSWAFRAEKPQIYGGSLVIVPPGVVVLPVGQAVVVVRRPQPLRCRVRAVPTQARLCVVRGCSRPIARVCTVSAPSVVVSQRTVSVVICVQVHKLIFVTATLAVPHRVLLSSGRSVVRAQVRLLPKRARALKARLRWRCGAQPLAIERFRCRSVPSSLVWQFPISRRAVSFEVLDAEHRRRCGNALQRAAKGYARVQNVYYPVPAHALARLEIDERLGALYVYIRRGPMTTPPGCLWVVSGVRVQDGYPVRAVLRVG